MQITIRRAVEADAAAACDVVRRSIRDLCVADHDNDKEILRQWLANKTEETLRRWIVSDASFTVVALRGERVCGFGMVHETGEVLLCYVEPEARFIGVSTLILEALEQQGRSWGLQKLFLTSTITARSFYERRGWIISGDPIAVFGMQRSFPMTKALAN
jgi:GNAT superfamily N-acetyltransferase